MNNLEKQREYLRLFTQQKILISDIYQVLEDTEDMANNYRDYMTTKPIHCEVELERVPQADYKTCCALLTMILREDHFCEGSFEKRYEKGQVDLVIERMLYLLFEEVQDIEAFVELLSSYNAQEENIHNQYQNPIVKNNLYQYLTYLQRYGVDVLFVGESAGYLGCRITGIPFTDEVQLKNEKNYFALGEWERDSNCGNTVERSATYIWEALRRRDEQLVPLMWNAFPFHPYKQGNEESNRAPLAKEVKVGKLFIEQLKRIFNICDENVYEQGNGVGDGGDQRGGHDGRGKPQLLCQQRQHGAYHHDRRSDPGKGSGGISRG